MKIGAEILGQEEVRNTFASDLNRGYLVVEVGLFPEAGKGWDIHNGDFSLRVGSDKMVRPVSGHTIASILQRKRTQKKAKDSDITIYPTATIGYETGPQYDPTRARVGDGSRRGGGWYGGGGVGVGVGGGVPQDPSVASADRSTMDLELTEKGLPEGDVSHSVAGYLYFPLPEAKLNRKVAYSLLYQTAAGERVAIDLKLPTR